MKGFCFFFDDFVDPSEFVVTGGKEEDEVEGTNRTAREDRDVSMGGAGGTGGKLGPMTGVVIGTVCEDKFESVDTFDEGGVDEETDLVTAG